MKSRRGSHTHFKAHSLESRADRSTVQNPQLAGAAPIDESQPFGDTLSSESLPGVARCRAIGIGSQTEIEICAKGSS
jgi:hypothetical protein